MTHVLKEVTNNYVMGIKIASEKTVIQFCQGPIDFFPV